jgi:hypothetical protein
MEFEEKDSVDAKVIALKFMPNIYQLQYDIDHDNELLKVGYSLDQSKDLTITYTLVFKDEDDKNLDNAWDQLRNTLYGRYEDIEGFSITLDSTNTNIKEIYFDGSWSNNLAYYDPSIAFHYIPIFGFFKTFTGINDFITSDGHLNIYIGTWNHFFSNTQQISGVPDDIWVKIADDSIEDSLFVNKNRQQLEEEYSERLVVSTTCPVDIVLQDPDGLLTYKTGSGIPFSFYNETDINGDGDLDDIVSVNVLKNGIYSITILPQVDAVPIDRFTLAVWANGQQRIIEKNFSLAMIQSTPYEVFSDEANIMITLKPTINFYPDIIDVKSNNKWITCRIELSSDSYVTNIDTGTVVVNDDVFAEWNMTQVGDSNSNGIPDLMVTFNQEILQTILEPGNHVELKVTGELYDGTKFEGVDYVEVISDDTPPRTIKNIGYPKKGEHDEWVTLDTAFNFTATDDFSGINATYYRIWYENSWTSWLKYSNNFTLSGEGKHYLEYYSVDNAGNVEETHNQTHYVNDSCWNSKWQYRKTITIDHTKVQVDLLNFPVLISLKSDCDLAAHAQADGDDLFFTDAQGTKLNHEIELYNCSTGRLVAWVNVTCLSSVKDTVLYLYYGNTQCGSQQNKGGTWNAEYLMVHHMNKPGTIYDSTAHELNAKGCGVTTSSIGKIDSCKYFDNINDRYDFGTPAMLNPELNSWTISLWTKITHLEPYFKMLRKWGCNSGFILYLYNGWGGHNYFKVGDGIKSVYRYWDKSWSDGYWHYLTIVINRNSNKIDLYLDGILHNGKGSGNIAGIGNITSLSSFRLYGGLNGLHDEFTISTTVRSSDWIKTCYINQKNPATFFSIGNQETVYSG